jgi:DNA-binding NarL/FixJ family response regulator
MSTAQGFQKFDAVLVDPDIQSRMRLKQATTAVPHFGKVHQLGELREAQQKLSGSDRADVVFISRKHEMEGILNFIKLAKGLPQGQDAAYILVLGAKNQDTSTVASSVMSGFDGFLFEPYSVDNLLEITQIAARVRKERSHAREEAAMKMLMTDLMNQIDLLAYLKQAKSDPGRVLKKFRETTTVLRTLSEESFKLYQSVAINMLENAPLPTKIFQKRSYGGASSRVKRKMEDKLIADLEKSAQGEQAEK